MNLKHFIADEASMLEFGAMLAMASEPGQIFFLTGQLGAGKTTLTRGFLRGLGYQDIVRSPTYTLVESYVLDKAIVHHFDLYRLADPEEVEYLGLRDYLTDQTISLIEWPEKAGKHLPEATLSCTITLSDFEQGQGRWLELHPHGPNGEGLLQRIVVPD